MPKRLLKYYYHKDVQYLIKQGKYKLFQQIILFGFSFILIWYLANYTSKEFLGNYQFIMATLGIMAIFSFPGIKDSILQSVARGYDYSLIKGTKKAIKFSLLGSLIFILISGYYYFLNDNVEITIVFLICALFFPFFYTLDNFIYFLEGKTKFKKEMVYNTIITFFKILVLMLSLLFFKENLIILFIVFFLSQILFYLYFFLKCKRRIKEKKDDKDLLNYGWFMTKISALGLITLRIDKILIGLFLGPSVLAIYIIGILIPEQLKGLMKPLFSSFMPQFANKKMIVTWKKIVFLICLGITVTLFLILTLPIIIKILFPKFIDSIKYSQIYSLIFIVVFINQYLSYAFRALKIKEGIYKPQVYSQIIYLICLIILLNFYNIMGLIIARIIQKFSVALLQLYKFKNSSKF